MASTTTDHQYQSAARRSYGFGLIVLALATVSACFFFRDGIAALLEAWQTPEYSHGPLIPVLSAILFLRQLKEYPVSPGPKSDRWPGVLLIAVALLMGILGTLSKIPDFSAYGLIVWVGGVLLISFGWQTGKHFWPPVVHLAFMLPLPGMIYYKVSTSLQFISSELGVWFLRLLDVPVFLDGNIIDLGTIKLHVAEACSGLRYMFPIMSFSYIFAVLYRGPMWQKAVLLLAAVPIAIFMNSVRIAIAGVIVQWYGSEWLDGFTHFFEGWVIFLSCILILFGLAWLMLLLHPDRPSLPEALDLEFENLAPQAKRIGHVEASSAMIAAAVLTAGAFAALEARPDRSVAPPERESFVLFPRSFGDWSQVGPRSYLSAQVEAVLGADDYHDVNLRNSVTGEEIGLFMAWYDDQSDGGVHSPEICLPGSGWEIAWLERSDIASELGSDVPFNINRAIIQKGEVRMMVFYWFQQKDRRIAWDFAAKYWLMVDSIQSGRTDGALVRMTTPIQRGESDADAEARLLDLLREIEGPLPRFVPNA